MILTLRVGRPCLPCVKGRVLRSDWGRQPTRPKSDRGEDTCLSTDSQCQKAGRFIPQGRCFQRGGTKVSGVNAIVYDVFVHSPVKVLLSAQR